MSPIENWNKCNWIGDIKKYDLEPKSKEVVENYDDYDMRHSIGGGYHYIHSRFDREEF